MSDVEPKVADLPSVMRTRGWADYGLIDSGNGRKLERYGRFTVVRPEPQCLWAPALPASAWDAADAVFDPTDEEDAGRWKLKGQPPETWPLSWQEVKFNGRFTSFRRLARRWRRGPTPGAEPLRLHRRRQPGHGPRRRGGDPCGRLQARGGLGAGERGAVRPGRAADPLDHRGRAQVCRPRGARRLEVRGG